MLPMNGIEYAAYNGIEYAAYTFFPVNTGVSLR